jgi:LysR family transcriptional regulator (chromosome initiation inhibitor)
MLEYRYLEALGAVIEEQGFEKAGEALHITQSAVTQRIRQLEESFGQVLVVRTNPPSLTDAGRAVLEHFRKVRILEQEFLRRTDLSVPGQKPVLALAVNADSLATWFSQVACRYFSRCTGYLDIQCTDQDVTHTLMTSGQVMGCISSMDNPFRGCKTDYLGKMEYRFVSTNQFARTYFPEGIGETAFSDAPKLHYSKDDRLLARWASRFFEHGNPYRNSHFAPSSEQFPHLIGQGSVCGMIPEYQYRQFKESYDLVDLSMEQPVSLPLYWHRWSIPSKELEILTGIIREEAGKILSRQTGNRPIEGT